ncbi:importin beta binding domain-containing protein [Ustulina deusta]|nr:importin beta binding domain-containing protein [Ustulina deusta]
MSDKYIPEHRRNQYKAKSTFKPDELRRRREEAQVEIRKAKREENLAKRRGIGTGVDRPGASLGAAPDSDDDTAPTESQVSLVILLCLSRVFIHLRHFRKPWWQQAVRHLYSVSPLLGDGCPTQ